MWELSRVSWTRTARRVSSGKCGQTDTAGGSVGLTGDRQALGVRCARGVPPSWTSVGASRAGEPSSAVGQHVCWAVGHVQPYLGCWQLNQGPWAQGSVPPVARLPGDEESQDSVPCPWPRPAPGPAWRRRAPPTRPQRAPHPPLLELPPSWAPGHVQHSSLPLRPPAWSLHPS